MINRLYTQVAKTMTKLDQGLGQIEQGLTVLQSKSNLSA